MSAQLSATQLSAAELGEWITCRFCRRGRHQVVRLVVCGHAAICSECLGEALAILRAEVAQKPAKITPEPFQAVPVAKPQHNGRAPPLTSRDGFTGEMCPMPDCGSFRMVRTGTCSICLDCYTSGGCG
jgi:hypothetical protein